MTALPSLVLDDDTASCKGSGIPSDHFYRQVGFHLDDVEGVSYPVARHEYQCLRCGDNLTTDQALCTAI